MANNITCSHISKRVGNFLLNDITFQVPKGCIVGMIGENGAGKTTTINLILDVLKADAGEITVFGKNYPYSKEEIGVVLDDAFFSPQLRIYEIEKLLSLFYNNWDKDLFLHYMKQFEIHCKKRYGDLSRGMKLKLQIASSLSHHPKLLILDEPTSGLDPVMRSELLDLFMDFIQDEENSILLSTHITSDLEQIADYIIFLKEGKIIFQETRDHLLEDHVILKCKEEDWKKIQKEDIICFHKTNYGYEMLGNKESCKKYKKMIQEKPTIEQIMILYRKGISHEWSN